MDECEMFPQELNELWEQVFLDIDPTNYSWMLIPGNTMLSSYQSATTFYLAKGYYLGYNVKAV